MGFIHNQHNKITIETNTESFIIHPSYGYEIPCPTCEGGLIMNADKCIECEGKGIIIDQDKDHLNFAKNWRESSHPEFLLDDLNSLIEALQEINNELAN